MTAHFLAAAYAHRDEIPAMREMYGFLALYGNMEPEFWPEERFCGIIKPNECADFHYGTATWMDHEKVETLIRRQELNENEAQQRLRGLTVIGYWTTEEY